MMIAILSSELLRALGVTSSMVGHLEVGAKIEPGNNEVRSGLYGSHGKIPDLLKPFLIKSGFFITFSVASWRTATILYLLMV